MGRGGGLKEGKAKFVQSSVVLFPMNNFLLTMFVLIVFFLLLY